MFKFYNRDTFLCVVVSSAEFFLFLKNRYGPMRVCLLGNILNFVAWKQKGMMLIHLAMAHSHAAKEKRHSPIYVFVYFFDDEKLWNQPPPPPSSAVAAFETYHAQQTFTIKAHTIFFLPHFQINSSIMWDEIPKLEMKIKAKEI